MVVRAVSPRLDTSGKKHAQHDGRGNGAAARGTDAAIAPAFRLPPLPPRPGEGHPIGPPGSRYAGDHADGLGQEPLLPAPRARAGGGDHRRQPADRADERPGRVAPGQGLRSRGVQQHDVRRRTRGGGGCDRARPQGVHLHDARAARDPRVPDPPEPGTHRPVRGRRGALRQPLGPRLPARVPGPGDRARASRPPDRTRPDGDRDRGGDRRHQEAAPHPRRRGRAHRVLPPQPPPGRGRDCRRGAADPGRDRRAAGNPRGAASSTSRRSRR